MMNDMLSQEEIDALLKGGNDTPDTNDSYETGLDAMEIDALGEIGNICMGTAATTLFTLLSQRVNITTPTVDVVTLNDIATQYMLPFVAVQVGYKEGITGTNLLILKEEDVKIITSLMMGGDGITYLPEVLDEIHLSAISEAMNQMIGSSSTALSEMIQKKIDILPPKVFKFSLEDDEIDFAFIKRTDPVIRISFRMTIGNLIDSNIMQILPIDFAKSLVDNMLYGASGKPEEVITQSVVMKEEKPHKPSTTYTDEENIYSMPSNEKYESNDYNNSNNSEKRMPQPEVNVQSVKFESFEPQTSSRVSMPENIEIIKDVLLNVSVELGKTKKSIDEILEFAPGTVIELDRLVGEPLDILVNGKKIAKGEVVVIDDNYGIRITDIIKAEKRLKSI